MPKIEEIEIQNSVREEISDLIGNPPGWILRSGISLVAFLFSIILSISYFIDYPDKISCNGIVTTENPPLELVSLQTGIIGEVYVEDLQEVQAGLPLLYFSNSAEKDDVLLFMGEVERLLNCTNAFGMTMLDLPSSLKLGVLNNLYATLQLQQKELRLILGQRAIFEQIETIDNEISNTEKLSGSLREENAIYLDEMKIIDKDFERHQQLIKEKLISQVEFEEVNKRYLQAKRQLESMKSGSIQNEIKINQLELRKSQLSEERRNDIILRQNAILETLSRIQEEYRKWCIQNHIYSEGNGKIELHSSVVEGTVISAGTKMGYLIPESEHNGLVGKVMVPTSGRGKIENGDQCIIRFASYPHKEYGSVISAVQRFSEVPQINSDSEANYEALIMMDSIIRTDYGELIPYSPNMEISVDIITESRSIIERIFEQILSIIKNT